MFDFEKLEVYQEMRRVNLAILRFLYTHPDQIDQYIQDQLKRASLSVLLNLAEGTGRTGTADKKRFYVMARASVYECAAILQLLSDIGFLEESLYRELYNGLEKVSRMLLGMIRALG